MWAIPGRPILVHVARILPDGDISWVRRATIGAIAWTDFAPTTIALAEGDSPAQRAPGVRRSFHSTGEGLRERRPQEGRLRGVAPAGR